MNQAQELHAALMRLQSLSRRVQELNRSIKRGLHAGKLTNKEAEQKRRDFWEQARKDRTIYRG